MRRFKIVFDKNKFMKELVKGFNERIFLSVDGTLNTLKSHLTAIEMREIDLKHYSSMVRSIRAEVNKVGNLSVTCTFFAGKRGGKTESFRVIYYEYGTGTKMLPPPYYSNAKDSTYNKARGGGKVIYQRPRGEWTDLGGNTHYSKLKGKPKPMKNIGKGQEISPTFWFSRAIKLSFEAFFKKDLQKVVKLINIGTYIDMTKTKKYTL